MNTTVGHWSRRPTRAAIALLGAASLLASLLSAVPVPAQAAVPGLVRASSTSVENSASPKIVTATCPSGKRLLGAGYEVSGATGAVTVSVLRPNGDAQTSPNAVTAVAYEEDTFSGAWKVTAYATCANQLSGLVRIEEWSTPFSDDHDSVTATCPAGKHLVGTGYDTGGLGNVVVDEITPNGSTTTPPTEVTVGAYESDEMTGSWSPLIAYAICADEVPGLVRVQSGGATNSNDHNTSDRTCPGGTVLTGAGFQFAGSNGEVLVDDFEPNGSSANAPTSITVAAYETESFSGDWAVQAFGICATR